MQSGVLLLDYLGHDGADVNSVAFQPNADAVVRGGADGTVQAWNAVTGARTMLYTGHKGPVSRVAFTPDGTQVVCGAEDGGLHVVETNTGLLLREYSGHASAITALAVSPVGALVASAAVGDSRIHLWDVQTGNFLRSYDGHVGELFQDSESGASASDPSLPSLVQGRVFGTENSSATDTMFFGGVAEDGGDTLSTSTISPIDWITIRGRILPDSVDLSSL
jgi:WD40 repeat protein